MQYQLQSYKDSRLRLVPGTKASIKKDWYKGIQYLGVRKYAWYYNEPQLTRNGMNFRMEEA